jgi:hypothetical protein
MKTAVEQILNDMKDKKIIDDGTFTGFYGGKTDNGYKLKINGEQTPVEWLVRQIKGYESDCEIFQQAKEMEKEQNEKYNELKEVIENIIEHLDEGIHLTLRKDSIIVEALRNTINQ